MFIVATYDAKARTETLNELKQVDLREWKRMVSIRSDASEGCCTTVSIRSGKMRIPSTRCQRIHFSRTDVLFSNAALDWFLTGKAATDLQPIFLTFSACGALRTLHNLKFDGIALLQSAVTVFYDAE